MTWRNCGASLTLIDEINRRWPGRSRISDGTVGDLAHSTRVSDHNPNAAGVVRARDITADGIDVAWLCEHLRNLGARGDARLANGGYLIFNKRITNPDFKTWRVYTGTNPHIKHLHVSFTRTAGGYDSTAPWGIAPTPLAQPVAQKDWFDMATEADLRRIMREEILAAAVPDYYTANPTDRMALTECLAWGTTHAANGRDASRAALAKATTLESKVDGLMARLVSGTSQATGPAQLSDTDVQRIAAAVLNELARRSAA